MDKSALIVGASRGLGLGLVREFLSRGWAVTATERTHSEALHATAASVMTADVSNHASIDVLAERLGARHFDLIFIVAGQWGPPHQSPLKASFEESAALFVANAIGPVAAVQRLAANASSGGTIALMTSGLASIANSAGNATLYSGTKAALNMMAKGFALSADAKGRTVLVIDPGWVKTDMGGQGASLSVEQSARGMADVIERRAATGTFAFVRHDGQEVPW
jgi:NAD(P)-dependent dehydrogenase (short-subunit alcohol dehydrogenase family)